MVVVRPPTVSPILIQLPRQKSVRPPIILNRIENRNPIRRHRDRPTEKIRLGRHSIRRWHRMQWNRPSISQIIGMRKWHLLLPRRNSHHHRMVRQPVRPHIEILLIPIQKNRLWEFLKGFCRFGSGASLRRRLLFHRLIIRLLNHVSRRESRTDKPQNENQSVLHCGGGTPPPGPP